MWSCSCHSLQLFFYFSPLSYIIVPFKWTLDSGGKFCEILQPRTQIGRCPAVQEMSIQKCLITNFRDIFNWPIHFNSAHLPFSSFQRVSLPKILFCDRSRRMRNPYVLRIHSFCEKTFVTGMSVCRTTLLIPILYHPHPLHSPVLIIWIIVITSGVDRIGWRKGKDRTGCRWWLCIYIRRIGSISLCFVCVSTLPSSLCEAIWIIEDRPWKLFSTPINWWAAEMYVGGAYIVWVDV